MKSLFLIGLGFFAWAMPAPGAENTADGTVPPGAKLTVAFDRSEYLLGENVLLQFMLENTGDKPFSAEFGGDYRGIDRSLRFKVTARDEQGRLAPDPEPNLQCLGGMIGPYEVNPGEKVIISLPLMRYCQIDRPGRYTIRATHDFGWKEGARKRPVAETSVTFRMPTAAEAVQVVDYMEKFPDDDQNSNFGTKSPDFADFRCLRYPVYLPTLLSRAQAGDLRALEGISSIPIREATSALMEVAGGPNAAPSLAAAKRLGDRLPEPNLPGLLPIGGVSNLGDGCIFYMGDNIARQRLAASSWDADLVQKARVLAGKLLARPEAEAVASGACIIQSVGTVGDAPGVFSALDRALQAPAVVSPRHDPQDDFIDFPAPIPALLAASETLDARGYDATGSPSGHGELLAYFHHWNRKTPDRPPLWRTLIDAYGANWPYPVREAALNSIPQPVPDSCVPFVYQGLSDPDFGVRIAACSLAQKSGRKEFLKPLLDIIATEHAPWLLDAASSAASDLGGGYDLLSVWADRLADQDLVQPSLNALQTVISGLPSGSYGTTGLSPGERLAIRDAWKKFLTDHASDLRAGKKFKYDDPALSPALFGRARHWYMPDGSQWWPKSDSTQ